MNRNPYHSPPSRHTRNLADRFLESTASKERINLEEIPFLVAKAVASGLIKLPGADQEAETKPVHVPVSDWRKISCIKCGQEFVRGQRQIMECTMCRLDKKRCTLCRSYFQPTQKWQLCCSTACTEKKAALSHFQTKPLPIHTCKVCNEPFTGRLSGAGWAKTCSDACANLSRSRFHAERRAAKLAAKASK
jgi:hypothetical protein